MKEASAIQTKAREERDRAGERAKKQEASRLELAREVIMNIRAGPFQVSPWFVLVWIDILLV